MLQLKNVVCLTECSECKELKIASTQARNTRASRHKRNIKIEENQKLNISKHLYQYRQGTIYQPLRSGRI